MDLQEIKIAVYMFLCRRETSVIFKSAITTIFGSMLAYIDQRNQLIARYVTISLIFILVEFFRVCPLAMLGFGRSSAIII